MACGWETNGLIKDYDRRSGIKVLFREWPTQFPRVRLTSTSSCLWSNLSCCAHRLQHSNTKHAHEITILLYNTTSFRKRRSDFWVRSPLSLTIRSPFIRVLWRSSITSNSMYVYWRYLYIHFTLRLLIFLTFLRLLRKRTACGASKTLKKSRTLQ